MGEISLQFYGLSADRLGPVPALLAAICLSLVCYGAWLFVRRQLRLAYVCVGAMLVGVGATVAIALFRSETTVLWMLLLAGATLTIVGIFYWSAYGDLGPGRFFVLVALRSVAILSLMLMLFKPQLNFMPDSREAKGVLGVLVDRSGSMATVDERGMPNRYDQALQMLAFQHERLERELRPAWHHFAKALPQEVSLDDLDDLSPGSDETSLTDIAGALANCVSLHRDNLVGVLLVSDGIHNAKADAAQEAERTGVPIYTVATGSTRESITGRRNIEVLSADCPVTVVKNSVTTVTCRVKMTRMSSIPAELTLGDLTSGKVLDTVRLWTDKPSETLTVKLKWTPRDVAVASGTADVRKLRVRARSQVGEVTNQDNTAELHVLVTESSLRVLHIAGSIRPELKFLRRLLDSDPDIELTTFIRISGKRFIARTPAEAGTLKSLPSTKEEFGLFDVIILDDLDSSFLTSGQMSRMRQFVNDGGALLMLGGQNSFGPGGYGGTDIDRLLPVQSGSRNRRQEMERALPQLTAAGEAHPVFEGIAQYFPGPSARQPGLGKAALPELHGCVEVASAKPAAEVLAVHPSAVNDAGPLIMLAVQRFGAGRSAAFMADTTWRWHLALRSLGREGPYQRFWLQLVRWLGGLDSPRRDGAASVVLRMDKPYVRIGQSAKLTAYVRDSEGRADETANVSATVTMPDTPAQGQTVQLARLADSGLFEAEIRPDILGQATVTCRADSPLNETIGTDVLALTVAPSDAEDERLARDDKLLREIAERSGGKFASLAGLPDLVDEIIQRARISAGSSAQVITYRLYNFVWLFLAFVALITTEWTLRRRWQLR